MTHNHTLGAAGEDLAATFLQQRGYTILDRNWRCSVGELDLVACTADRIVAVEVKTRQTGVCGHPFEAITPAKVARLYRLVRLWCEAAEAHGPVQVDAIAVSAPPDAPAVIEHLQAIG